MAQIEHVNLTVSEFTPTVEFLKSVFGWDIRWEGPSLGGGTSVHIGDARGYLALYNPPQGAEETIPLHRHAGTLNHIGIVVGDLDVIEQKIVAAGYQTDSHADYEPGRRFYVMGPDNIEYEIIEYDA